jgi:arginase
VLDPNEFPHVACPTPDGLSLDLLKLLLRQLKADYDIVGFSILEFMPVLPAPKAADEIAEILNSLF